MSLPLGAAYRPPCESSGGRRDLDAYWTPLEVARMCLGALDLPTPPKVILEPSCGGGSFLRACRERWPSSTPWLIGVDVNPHATGLRLADAGYCMDWLEVRGFPPGPPDLIIGNPPYCDAEAHVRNALEVVALGGLVGMLLRLAFLEGQGRRSFWHLGQLRSVHVLSERPSFTGGGTDACAYGWFCWESGYRGDPRLGWLP